MKSYEIKTVNDIVNAVIDSKNKDAFLKDFAAWLDISITAKSIGTASGADVEVPSFTWNDDGENGVLKSIKIEITHE